jgi:hypothetical protein
MVNLKKQITMGEGLSIMLGIFSGVFIAWMNVQVRLAVIEATQQTNKTAIENIKQDNQRNNFDVSGKLDRLSDDINQVKIILQNKEDRK